MSIITLPRRFRTPTLIAAVSILVAGRPAAPSRVHGAGPSSDYAAWLEQRSMLYKADSLSNELEGNGAQWHHSFGTPQPRQLVKAHSVWLLHYPGSVIPNPGKSVIATWGDSTLWNTLADIGVTMLHTCPTKQAGGIVGRKYTPTIDGWFDRIALQVDSQLGTDTEYREMVRVATARGAGIAGDMVPLHTGMGADFRLAELKYKDYDGIYSIVEIGQQDWPLLPEISDTWSTALVSKEAAAQLTQKGYIPGLINSADANPDAKKWSGWSATGTVVGVDGKPRRWVFLHVFKPAQPTLNWSDPSYASRRMLAGDIAHSIRVLGDRVERLDAVPFLGIEPKPDTVMTWYFMHPLSITGTNDLSFMVRKLGGWSFQELNVPMEQFRAFAEHGPDLGYDFFTRAQVLSPLLDGDARPLRIAHQLLLKFGIPQGSLIHDLQNHDEITFQLVDLGYRTNMKFQLGKEALTGAQLKERILEKMRSKAAGAAAPYNLLYRPEKDGVATTFAGFAAPALGIHDPYHATPEQIAQIRRAHLLFAHANAMQPGVFALSSWDLVGALPIPKEMVAERMKDGDYRWVNRGGVDLMGANPDAKTSAFGLPRAQALYGPLPEQLKQPDSFASQIKRMLAARKRYHIDEGTVIAAPDVADSSIAVLVMRLPDSKTVALTTLNYGRTRASVNLDLSTIRGISASQVQGRKAHDIVADQDAGTVSTDGRLTIDLAPISGRTIVLEGR